MWNRACYRVHFILTDHMGSSKNELLLNSWKAGKIIACDSITQAEQERKSLLECSKGNKNSE